MRILIANRGEIASRIAVTAHRLGHQTAAAYADPDRDAPFVRAATLRTRLGPAGLDASYLSIEALMDAAARTDADAVHPGYGFLAESAAFAEAVQGAGLIWIGPGPDTIACMGSKIEARRIAAAAGVPVIPGYDATQDPAALAEAAERIGYPLMVKASAGGGGKGIRIAREPGELGAALQEASSEAEHAFGNGALIIERFIQRPRHVEVQVVGDEHGAVVDLGTRECSLQRRFQKIVEEAPAPNLSPDTAAGLRSAARELARSIGYESAGTVEFIVDDTTEEWFFLEMNTRLQVEHPVTELVTGLDLVELQLLVSQGRPLPVTQDDIVISGHAFEARINAEDPWDGFAPRTGTVFALEVPHDARWDSGIDVGSTISTSYDPMVAKLIAGAAVRDVARRRLIAALEGLLIGGLTTNAGFLHWLLRQPAVADGKVTTRFLDGLDLPPPPAPEPIAAGAARAWQAQRDAEVRDPSPWSLLGRFRVTPHRGPRLVAVSNDQGEWEIPLDDDDDGTALHGPVAVDLGKRLVAVNVDGATHTFDVPPRQRRWARESEQAGADAAALVSPFPGTVAEVRVAAGDLVDESDIVVVIEAMKMLHSLPARGRARVRQVHVAAGDQVDSQDVLASFDPATSATDREEPQRRGRR